jgi:ABC-type multidrug transport system ATPase subunit
MSLEISGLSKKYPNGVQALSEVTLNIPPGMFGLLGPNGAGKSSLMRTIATLQEADAGTIKFEGIDVLREKKRVREILGYLPQEFGVYPKVTALTLLDHLAVLKGIRDGKQRREVVNGLLKRVNLYDARNRRLGTFSGGMKQRFGIAQALLGSPKLIIVDEPTAGLDPEERVRFLNLLAEIGENIVIILSTHIVDDVADLCQQMAIISQGRVVQSGDPLKLIEGLQGRIWRRFVTPQQLAEVQGKHHVISTRRVSGRLVLRVHGESKPDNDFESVTPDLEDVYFLAIHGAPSGVLEAVAKAS